MRLVAAALLLGWEASAAAQPVVTLRPGETLLTVEATGEHSTRPDMMTISAGVVTTGKSAQDALRANGVRVEQLIEVVRRSGIEARDVRT